MARCTLTNLRDYYSREQTQELLGELLLNPDANLGKNTPLYLRSKVNEILEARIKQNPSLMFKIRAKIIGMPAYDVDLTKWIPYQRAIERFPLSHQRLIEGKDTKDRLKIIKTKIVYNTLLYSVESMEYYIALKPPTAYYDKSYEEIKEIEMLNDYERYIVETRQDRICAWYTAKECAIVLGIPRRFLWNWIKARKRDGTVTYRRFGRGFVWYIPEVHTWLENNESAHGTYKTANWKSRHVYLAERRIGPEFIFDEWVTINEINKYTYHSPKAIYDNCRLMRVEVFNVGGVKIYNKAGIKEMLEDRLAAGRLIFPFKTKHGEIYENEDEWLKKLEEW